jgi:alkylation response protein AidB-like acyl-CoA dehydrogenase
MQELLELTRELADKELRPAVDAAERAGTFPRETFRLLGRSGLLGLPYPERWGGGGQPYEVYLQVVEELARSWLTVGLGESEHTLTSFPLATAGTPEQQ